MQKTYFLLGATLLSFSIGLAGSPALAQDLVPPVTDDKVLQNSESGGNPMMETTHPMLRLTPDKSEMVRLDRNAVSVIVGNPEHLSVLLDTPDMLVLVPRAPGATHFSVLDEEGEVVMQRHVIVASPKKDYVRIRRSCANAAAGDDCRATSVYFCPDICHEVGVTQLGGNAQSPNVAGSAPGGTGEPILPGADGEGDSE